MKQQPIKTDPYASPSTRVITVTPGLCIAQSIRGAQLQNMQGNEIYDEDF